MPSDDSSQFEIVSESPAPPLPAGDMAHQLADLHLDAWGWALAVSGSDPSEAEEVLQIAYLRILDGRAHFSGRSLFQSWVFGVIRNVARERRRSAGAASPLDVTSPSPIVDPGPGPGEHLTRSLVSSRLRRSIARLSERQQQILHLVFYQEMTIAEAAEILGISPGSGRTHYERGKARLRELLEDGGDEA